MARKTLLTYGALDPKGGRPSEGPSEPPSPGRRLAAQKVPRQLPGQGRRSPQNAILGRFLVAAISYKR